MKKANLRYIMADGQILYTLEELEAYGQSHTFPDNVQYILNRICNGELSEQKEGA